MADDFIPGKTECIHLIHEHAKGNIKRQAFRDGIVNAPGGTFDIACSPGSQLPKNATSETVAVTCPLCKQTDVFKSLEAEQTSGLGGAAGISEADRKILEHMATQK